MDKSHKLDKQIDMLDGRSGTSSDHSCCNSTIHIDVASATSVLMFSDSATSENVTSMLYANADPWKADRQVDHKGSPLQTVSKETSMEGFNRSKEAPEEELAREVQEQKRLMDIRIRLQLMKSNSDNCL